MRDDSQAEIIVLSVINEQPFVPSHSVLLFFQQPNRRKSKFGYYQT
jgi:hypothetical protein